MSKTNASYDLEWLTAIGLTAGYAGTATATGATSLTGTGTPWSTNQWSGCVVVTTTTGRYANIISNTTSVLTLDQWYDPATPGGAAGSTPGTTEKFVIMPQAPPSQFMGISTNSSAVGSGDTTLPGEITTAAGGLKRKQGTLAHSASASTGTVAATFTGNGSDSYPAVVHKMGISPSILSTVNNLLQTVLNADATLSISGDQLTVTDTITL